MVYLKSFKTILRAAFGEEDDVQYEYVILVIRLMQNLNMTAKAAILDELSIYESQIETNQRLKEVLSNVDL